MGRPVGQPRRPRRRWQPRQGDLPGTAGGTTRAQDRHHQADVRGVTRRSTSRRSCFVRPRPGYAIGMRQINSRTLAVIGVLATAVLTACLVLPVSRQFGTVEGSWLGAALFLVPTIALLIATGFRYYGLWRSVEVAVVVMVITAFVTVAVSAFGFAGALS